MEKRLVYLILLFSLSIAIFTLYELNIFRMTGFFVGFGEPSPEYEWWNVSWHYRIRLEINSTQYSRTNWPVEQEMNFTDLLPSGSFDENSTRVFEYNSTGDILYEVPSQFDKDDNYDSSTNAVGTLVFLMNGTTQANNKRIYYVYYDTIENGNKNYQSYATNLTKDWTGQIANVNSTFLKIYIDTNRAENTSGIYRIEDRYQNVIITTDTNNRTSEYVEYFNGTNNLTFDLRNNATFIEGPVRLTIKQIGDEVVFGNTGQKTNENIITKKYYIYNRASSEQYGSFVKIYQEIKNTAGYNVYRNSTPSGALSFDLNRTLSSGNMLTQSVNTTDPFSWVWGSGVGGEMVGIVNIMEGGTNSFYAKNNTNYGRIGIQLNNTTISPNSAIKQTSLVYFAGTGGSNAVTEFIGIKDRYASPINVTQQLPERVHVIIVPITNATIYNRNETIFIKGNISAGDPYNFTKYMNVTLDMGTVSQVDDQTIILYDDGTHGDQISDDKAFTNTFEIDNNYNTGMWNLNFSVYTNNSEFLNSTILTLNITDVYNATVNIFNKKPMVNTVVVANIYVTNIRKDSWIPGAIINCSYDSSEVINKTDYGNGTYQVNFTAPIDTGSYSLSCNATKNGNLGNGYDNFSTEPGKTYVDIKTEPSSPVVYNITLYDNDSFVITANVTNFGNGTAYSTNITLELLNGWDANITKEECGDMNKNSYLAKDFKITVPNNTAPGNYYVNATIGWKNPDESLSSNMTEINVTIEHNPKVEVKESKISGETGDGIWTLVGNFTVSSIGNDALQNISYSCVSGDVCNSFTVGFIPQNTSSLGIGTEQNVSVNVSIPFAYSPGTYNGTVNVSAENDGFYTFILEVNIPTKTNVSVSPTISNYTAYNVTQQNNETFSFDSSIINIGNGSARVVKIGLVIPSGWTSNSSLEDCGDLIKGSACAKGFNITIPKGTAAGNYLANVTTNWTNPDNSDGSNVSSINVTIASNPALNVSEENVSGNVMGGIETTISNFTVLSVGNGDIQNINFNCYSGTVCQNFSVEFIPSSISSIAPNSNRSIMINVTTPLGFTAGNYTGNVNVSAQNDKFDIFVLTVRIIENRTWTLYPENCEKSIQQPEGVACEVNVSNLGNEVINFTISPESGNYTKVNETSFAVNMSDWHVFKITYNTTGIPPGIYNSTFVVDTVQSNVTPDNKSVKVALIPYIPPTMVALVTPNDTEQNSTIKILANITDSSGSGIAWTRVNVTRPNGTIDSLNMFLISTNGNLSRWELTYPNGTNGSTIERGLYNLTIYSRDNIGNEENKNSTLLIYAKINIQMSTLTNTYYQGDTASIYYVARNVTNGPLENITVNFTIKNSQGNITFISGNYLTNSEGGIVPLPTFSIPSDAILGDHYLISYSKYFDNIINRNLEIQKNHTFQVLSRVISVTGLFADLETAVVWYPPLPGYDTPVIKFGILVYNGEGEPVDPDTMNLTVYRPDGMLYFSDNMANMQRQMTGYYIYQRSMLSDTPTGMYLAVINVTQGQFQTLKLKSFRVARGGPYDLWVQLMENEVRRGDYLDFIIKIENKGEVSQDVHLEWWVSSPDRVTYYHETGWVYTPSLSTQTLTKQAYIYTNQPLGTYTLNVKMTYDSVQPPIIANSTFIVLSSTTTPNVTPPTYPVYIKPTVPTGFVPEVPEIAADITIEKYNHNISLARGMTMPETVTVRNSGNTDLNNVSLFILGLPTSWFSITPENYVITQGDYKVFNIDFNIPDNANTGEYKISFIVTSGVVSDKKDATVTIFQSIEELLQNDINVLKQDLQKLIDDTDIAKNEGKNVTSVLIFINETRNEINEAETSLRNNNTYDALEHVAIARSLIERANNLLLQLEFPVAERLFAIPMWLIILILLLIIAVLVIMLIILKRSGRRLPRLRPYVIPLGKVAEKVKEKEGKQDLVKERERILRMLEVLERERKEEIINNVVYREMKKDLDDKLAKIEKKFK